MYKGILVDSFLWIYSWIKIRLFFDRILGRGLWVVVIQYIFVGDTEICYDSHRGKFFGLQAFLFYCHNHLVTITKDIL